MKKSNLKNQKIKEIAALFGLIADHFRIFISEVMEFDNAPFHNQLDDDLSNELNKKLVIAMPRGFGKTNHISIAYPLYEIAKNHNVRILLVSSTATIAKDSLVKITNHIDQNKRYRYWAQGIDPNGRGVTPKLRTRNKREERWTGESITIDRDDLKIKDPTISAVGLFGSILSRRADIIIVDDLVNQENSASEEQRQKIKDWVYTTLMPVLVPGGKFIYLGNTWDMDDLVNNLLKDPQFDVRKRIPSILHEAVHTELWDEWANIHLDEALPVADKREKAEAFYQTHKTEMDEGVEVLWPAMFPYAYLYLKRIGNPYSFARMFMCDPSIRPNQRFMENDIEKALKKGEELILQDKPREEIDVDYTASGLDLAISLKDQSDDTVLLSLDRVRSDCGIFKTGDFVIRNIERGKFQPNEVRERVERHYYAVGPIGIRVENNGYQESMVRDLSDRSIPITSYKTGGEKNDSDIGVNSLSVLLSQGKLILPYSKKDARTRKLIAQLIGEMRRYPDGHTGDSLMAFWFAFSEIRDHMSNTVIIPGPRSPQSEESKPLKELEKEADELMRLWQEYLRNGDPALEKKYWDLKNKIAARELKKHWDDEARDGFNGMMRKWK